MFCQPPDLPDLGPEEKPLFSGRDDRGNRGTPGLFRESKRLNPKSVEWLMTDEAGRRGIKGREVGSLRLLPLQNIDGWASSHDPSSDQVVPELLHLLQSRIRTVFENVHFAAASF